MAVCALGAVLVLGAAACSGGATNARPTAGRSSAAALYQAGHSAMEQGDYAGAATSFRNLETLYPADPNTLQGQIELIYAYYKQGETASVLMAAERFIHDQPAHPNLDYVYYLRGLALFTPATAALAQEGAEIRPQPPTADLALEYFDALLRRFPASKYAEDARNRMLHLKNGLAAFELATAKIHLNRGDYVNAGLHARAVLENYPDSGVTTEAATVANMAYRMLDLQKTAPPADAAAGGAPRPDIAVIAPPAPVTERAPVEAAPPPAAAPLTAPTTPAPALTATAAPAAASPQGPVPTPPAAVADASTPDTPPAAEAGATPRREDWIARQDPRAYTLQLLSVSDRDALLAFIQAHPLADLAWFETRREGYPWYSLIHGVYPDAATARAAAAALPADLGLPAPWLRRLGEIQALMVTPAAAPPP